MTNFVAPKDCKRCGGTGNTGHLRDFGMCYACSGHGMVETDRATLQAAKVRAEGRKALGKAALSHSREAHWGLCQLEINEPERLTKAIDSFLAGDSRVLSALANYAS